MKNRIQNTVIGFLAFVMLAAASPAAAQQAGVFVVDIQQIWAETELGQDLARQRNEIRDEIQGRLTTRSEELQTNMTDLNRQRDEFIITEEVYTERANALRQGFAQMQASAQQAEQYLLFVNNRAQEVFITTIQEDMDATLDDRNAAVLIDRSTAAAIDDSRDVSADVVRRVNRRITELDLQPYITAPESGSSE